MAGTDDLIGARDAEPMEHFLVTCRVRQENP